MSGKHGSFVANSISLLKQTFSEWLDDKVPQLGAALAYYTVFSLAPLGSLAPGNRRFPFPQRSRRGLAKSDGTNELLFG